mgnify:CR=1 FL=1
MDFRSSSTLFVSVAAAVRTGVSMERCTAALSTHTQHVTCEPALHVAAPGGRGAARHTRRDVVLTHGSGGCGGGVRIARLIA